MVSFLERAYRGHRLRRRRGVHRRNLNFRKVTKLVQILKKREDARSLRQLAFMALEATFCAREYIAANIADDDDSYYPNKNLVDRVFPTIMQWHGRLKRDIRHLEASVLMMRDKYQGGSVNIYSMDQMQAMEDLHGIGWRGNMRNPTENAAIAERINRLLQP